MCKNFKSFGAVLEIFTFLYLDQNSKNNKIFKKSFELSRYYLESIAYLWGIVCIGRNISITYPKNCLQKNKTKIIVKSINFSLRLEF